MSQQLRERLKIIALHCYTIPAYIDQIVSLPDIAILHPDQKLPGWTIPLRQLAKTEVYHHAQDRMLEEGWRRVIKEE